MLSITWSGSFTNTERFLNRMAKGDIFAHLGVLAQQGVNALSSATPVESGLTAASWDYEVTKTRSTYKIVWYNTNVNNGVNIAIILQYGHGTGTGGYISGQDYINPAMRPVFDRIADEAWKVVTSS